MKKSIVLILMICAVVAAPKFTFAQNDADAKATPANGKSKSDPEVKAAAFVAALNLNDTAKANKVKQLITTHLTAVRDWHNNHAYTLVPEGLNRITGKVFTKLER